MLQVQRNAKCNQKVNFRWLVIVVYQVICEEKVKKGFGIEYFELRYVGGVLYKTRQLAQEEIKRCQDSATFKNCRFTINEVRESK